MLSWDAAVQFGQALEQIKSLDSRMTHAESEIATIKSVVYRGALLLALATAGVMTNASADSVGEAAASFVKSMRK